MRGVMMKESRRGSYVRNALQLPVFVCVKNGKPCPYSFAGQCFETGQGVSITQAACETIKKDGGKRWY
jgi:hypothetical protein